MRSEFWDLFELEPDEINNQEWQHRLCTKALDVFLADGVSLFIAEPCGNFRFANAVGLSRDIPVNTVFQSGEGLAGRAAASGQATLVGNEDAGAIRSHEVSSGMILPLMSRGRCVAVMNLTRATGRDVFGRFELETSRAVSRYLGAAIANAQYVCEFKETERLKRLAQAGQMTASLAHEIRNPLTTIIAAAQSLDVDSDEASGLASMIEHEAKRLNRLCDELLDFSKADLLRLQPHDLTEVCTDVVESHRPLFEQKGVKLALNTAPANLEMDRNRFEQVLGNLLRNALEATPSGGAVDVVATESSVSVSDTGTGVDPAVESTLFEPFFTTKTCGTGLGLPNVKRWVEAHGWSIQVSNRGGEGATFQIRFNQRKAA
ncbi:MAG TPA: GAF domain-containing sensor histidine kinase [Fimbriimonadaceae bacterium]|nr:GAF domain-containing sensor histidine kinase [Fimbriimonadaceae bacterium]